MCQTCRCRHAGNVVASFDSRDVPSRARAREKQPKTEMEEVFRLETQAGETGRFTKELHFRKGYERREDAYPEPLSTSPELIPGRAGLGQAEGDLRPFSRTIDQTRHSHVPSRVTARKSACGCLEDATMRWEIQSTSRMPNDSKSRTVESSEVNSTGWSKKKQSWWISATANGDFQPRNSRRLPGDLFGLRRIKRNLKGPRSERVGLSLRKSARSLRPTRALKTARTR